MLNKILILNESDNPDPFKQTKGAAGIDLYANENVTVHSFEPILIGTGIKLILPPNLEAQVRLRSSLALKGLFIPNAPGTIDSDYRGEIKVIMSSTAPHPVRIEKGMRIAQLVPSTVPMTAIEKVTKDEFESEIYASSRGSGGFGSTGGTL